VSNQHDSIAEFAKRLFINGRDLSPLPLRLLEGNLTMEAAFLIKSKEIGHQLCLNEYSYPGNPNRLELLLLSGYVFREIQNNIQPLDSHLRISSSANELLTNTLRTYLQTELGCFSDALEQCKTLESERVRIVKAFIKLVKDKNTP
jgi:hypothetical protein